MADLLTREDADALARRLFGLLSAADAAEARLDSERYAQTRYAGNAITTAGDSRDTRATLTARIGSRSASTTFNRFDDASLERAVTTAERLARLAPEHPEQLPLLGPQEYPSIEAFFPETDQLGAAERADAVRAVAAPAEAGGLVATGFVERRSRASAVANTAGLFAYHRETLASHTVTVRTGDGGGSGWAGTTHNDWTRMTPPAALGERAIEKARRSADPRAFPAGSYTVVLEPTAVGNLVQLLGGHLDARAAAEGRSFFSRAGGTRVAERVAAPSVSLVSDPAAPDVRARPFTGDGLPLERTAWITDGVLERLAVTRDWAAQANQPPRPYPGFLEIPSAGPSVDELVRGVERGLLVTRFWYIRAIDPRSVSYTGLTRDGTFLIENGAIAGAVNNLRFNQSVMEMLGRVEAMGRSERVVASESGGLGSPIVVPALVVREFRFTSVSEAV